MHPAVVAFHNGTLGFGFSGSGFLLFYFLGALDALRGLGIVNSATPMAGASGGALTAVAAGCGGSDPRRLLDQLAQTSDACSRDGRCFHTLDAKVRTQLRADLPPDAAARCSGRGFVAVTRARPGERDVPVLLGERYGSFNELVDSAAASAYLPYWSGPSPFTEVDGFEAYDGGFSDPLPCPPPGANVTYCVRVQAQPFGTPASGASEQSLQQFVALARLAAANSTNATLAAAGGQAPEINPEITAPPPPSAIDLAPGKPGLPPLPFPAAEWQSFSLLAPPNATTAREIFEIGRRDAAAWAEQTGLKAAAAARIRAGGGRALLGAAQAPVCPPAMQENMRGGRRRGRRGGAAAAALAAAAVSA